MSSAQPSQTALIVERQATMIVPRRVSTGRDQRWEHQQPDEHQGIGARVEDDDDGTRDQSPQRRRKRWNSRST
jgi:hypothetical protein